MKLIHKFFLAFFITNITLVGLMFSFIYINFATDFNRFVEKEEQKHVIGIKQQLLSFYAENNSWQAIYHNTRLWRSIVEPNAGNKAVKHHNNNEPLSKHDNKPATASLWINLPADLLKTGQRISLYNQSKQVVVGKSDINDNPYIEPIMIDNDIVGWLGLVPSRLVEDSPATTFLTAQFHNYFMITLLVILLAFIMAIVLSRHLTKPIKQIVAATNELNQGNFTTRTLPKSRDEIGILANNVNKLARTLVSGTRWCFYRRYKTHYVID